MRSFILVALAACGLVACDDAGSESPPQNDLGAAPALDAGAADAAPTDASDATSMVDTGMPPAPDAAMSADATPAPQPDADPMPLSDAAIPPDAAPPPLTPEADCMGQPQPIAPALQETRINGQRMLYSDTPTETGILFLFHGNGGSPDIWLTQTEHVLITLAALERGFLVIALKSIDMGWSKVCCNGEDRCCEEGVCCTDQNDDIDNVRQAIAHVVDAGLANEQTALYAVGYSNGGGFTGRLTQGLELVAAATVNSGSSGSIIRNTDALPPMFFQGARADPIVRPEAAITNHASFVERGVRTALRINEPAPLTPGRLSRIDGISCEQSITLYDGMMRAGLIDADGFLTGSVEDTMGRIEANPYWQSNGLDAHSRNVTLQFRELKAEHPLSGEWADDIMAFMLLDEG